MGIRRAEERRYRLTTARTGPRLELLELLRGPVGTVCLLGGGVATYAVREYSSRMRPAHAAGPRLAWVSWIVSSTVPATFVAVNVWAYGVVLRGPYGPRADGHDLWSGQWWGPFEFGTVVAVLAVPSLVHRRLRRHRDPAVAWERAATDPLGRNGYRGAPPLVASLRDGALRDACAGYLVRLGVALACMFPLLASTVPDIGLYSCKCIEPVWRLGRPLEQTAGLSLLFLLSIAFQSPTRRRLLGVGAELA